MTSRFVALGVVASVLLLVGCAAAPTLPAGLSVSDTKALIDSQREQLWASMFPGQSMPIVKPIKTVSIKDEPALWQGCILDLNIPGVAVTYEGAISSAAAAQDAFNRQSFICLLEYPPDPTKPEELGYLSDAQITFLYGYYQARLVPCLRSIGFTVGDGPSLATFVKDGANNWLPYYDMVPVPTTDAQWNLIDLRCAPPPFFAGSRPGPLSASSRYAIGAP
ncbi:MAG: hypothetical protein ABJA94_07195 [Rhodoglobus sp.]